MGEGRLRRGLQRSHSATSRERSLDANRALAHAALHSSHPTRPKPQRGLSRSGCPAIQLTASGEWNSTTARALQSKTACRHLRFCCSDIRPAAAASATSCTTIASTYITLAPPAPTRVCTA